MDENDPLSEKNKIPLGHNRINGAVYSKINFNVEICSTLRYLIVIPRFIPCSILVTITTAVFITLLTTNTLFIVTIYCAQ